MFHATLKRYTGACHARACTRATTYNWHQGERQIFWAKKNPAEAGHKTISELFFVVGGPERIFRHAVIDWRCCGV